MREDKEKIGRNDPCPCGSGKKYKNCCGARSRRPETGTPEETERVAINRAIAYQGKIGRQRADFCRHYIEHQQAIFARFTADLAEQVARNGETITCRPGCCHCCSQFFLASLQECEAIVYYLYQHDAARASFLKSYPVWRARIRENEAAFTRIQQLANELANRPAPAISQAYVEATTYYLLQDIKCPFLNNGLCSIYQARPFACASIAAATVSEWCGPLSDNKPRVYQSRITSVQLPYYRQTRSLLLFPMPLGVYEILNHGYIWLSRLPGLESLNDEVTTDPEVIALIHKLENKG